MSGIDPSAIEALVESLGDDREGVRIVAGMFRENAQALRDEMVAAVARGEPAAVARAAHAVRGTAAIFGASALRDVAAHLEKAGDAGGTAECAALLPALTLEVDAVVRDLDAWLVAGASNPR